MARWTLVLTYTDDEGAPRSWWRALVYAVVVLILGLAYITARVLVR